MKMISGASKMITMLPGVILLSVLLFIACHSRVDKKTRGNDGQTNTAAKNEVLATDDQRTNALRRGDVEPLKEIYADDYTLVTPAGVIQSKADQIKDISSGDLRYKTIETLNRTVRVYDDVAIVLSWEKNDIIRGGQQVGGNTATTRTYKKFGKVWRVIATHVCFVKP